MYKYNVRVKKMSGPPNYPIFLTTKNLVIKSRLEKTDKEIFAAASRYYKKAYDMVIESADITKSKIEKLKISDLKKCHEFVQFHYQYYDVLLIDYHKDGEIYLDTADVGDIYDILYHDRAIATRSVMY